MPQRLHPWRGKRAKQKIAQRHYQVREDQRAPEAEAVRQCAAKNRQEPHHQSKRSDQPSGKLGGKMKLLVQVDRENRCGGVVSQPFEKLGGVGHPKGRIESGANFAQPLSDAQPLSLASCESRTETRTQQAEIVAEAAVYAAGIFDAPLF